jgi:hypothetical protein
VSVVVTFAKHFVVCGGGTMRKISLLDLDDDVLGYVLKFMHASSVIPLRRISQRFREIIDTDSNLWKVRCLPVCVCGFGATSGLI